MFCQKDGGDDTIFKHILKEKSLIVEALEREWHKKHIVLWKKKSFIILIIDLSVDEQVFKSFV